MQLNRARIGPRGTRLLAKLSAEDGQAIVLMVTAIGVLLATALLVLDGSRAYVLHTQVQSAADQAALAAAWDLAADGSCAASCRTTLDTYVNVNWPSGSAPPSTTAGTLVSPCTSSTPNCYTAPYSDSGGTHVGELEVRLHGSGPTFFGGAVAGLLGGAISSLNVSASAVAVQRTGTQGDIGGNYIYAVHDVIVHGDAQLEEPVLAGHDVDLSNANNRTYIWPDARLVSAGNDVIMPGSGSGAIGAGTGTAAEPLTLVVAPGVTSVLQPTIPVQATTNLAPADTNGNHNVYPIVKIDPIVDTDPVAPGTCTATPCEYVKYGGFGAGNPKTLQVASRCGSSGAALCRGYGGYGAPPAATHAIGASVDGRVAQLWVKVGCGTGAGAYLFSNCLGQNALNLNIYAGPTVNNCAYPADLARGCSSQPFAPAQADAASAYQNAPVGGANSATSCTGSGAPSFDNDAILNHSLPGSAQDLTPNNKSYTCTGTAPDGTKGELAWNANTSTLTAHGLIFIDGDFQFSRALTYQTQADPNFNNGDVGATIWTSGTMLTISNTQAVCAVAGASSGQCDVNGATWNPLVNVLGIVAAGTCAQCGTHVINVNADFQGDIYTTGNFSNSSGMSEQGLIIAYDVNIFSGTGNPVPEVTTVPAFFPGRRVIETGLVG